MVQLAPTFVYCFGTGPVLVLYCFSKGIPIGPVLDHYWYGNVSLLGQY